MTIHSVLSLQISAHDFPEEELARAMVMVMTDMNFLVISRGVYMYRWEIQIQTIHFCRH